MKFTYTQKKWAMTGVLLAVLGFNVSMNKHTDGIASADFASESGDLVESKIATADGVLNVKYIKSGENEVMAVIPKVTEGKTCDVCGTTYTLDASLEKNKSNIDELNVQLLKQISKGKPLQAPRETQVVEATEERQLTLEEKVGKDLDTIKRRANGSPSRVAKELSIYFGKHSKEQLPSKQMLQFILQEVIAPMDAEIEKTAKASYQDVKTGVSDQYSAQKEMSEAHEEMFNATSELISSISVKNKDVRETTIKMVGALYSSENQKVSNVTDLEERDWRMRSLPELNNTIFSKNRIAFQALSEKESANWAKSYTDLLVDTMMKIDSQYNQGQTFGQVQPAPNGTVSQGGATGVRGGATRESVETIQGGRTALPAPSSIKSSGAPGPIAAPVQGVPSAGMTGYQLQTQSAQDGLAPRVQLAPRGY